MESVEKVHPPYMFIWFVLAVLMFAKVGIMMLNLPTAWTITLLVLESIGAALLVALYYMHLRFEPKKIWFIVLAPIPLIFILILTVIQEF